MEHMLHVPLSLQIPRKASKNAVRRMLLAAGFVSVTAKHKPLLSRVNMRKRLAFARAYLNYTKWGKVIFSDEKIFRVRPGGRVRCWYRKSEQQYQPKYTVPTVAHSESVMVWAAMDGSGAISLRRCPPRVNAAEYQTLLGSALPFIKRRCVRPHRNHMQAHSDPFPCRPSG